MVSIVMLATQLAEVLKYMLLDRSCPARAGGLREHYGVGMVLGRPLAYSGVILKPDHPGGIFGGGYPGEWVLCIFDGGYLAQAFKAELEALPEGISQQEAWHLLTREGQLGPVDLSDWLITWGYHAGGFSPAPRRSSSTGPDLSGQCPQCMSSLRDCTGH